MNFKQMDSDKDIDNMCEKINLIHKKEDQKEAGQEDKMEDTKFQN